ALLSCADDCLGTALGLVSDLIRGRAKVVVGANRRRRTSTGCTDDAGDVPVVASVGHAVLSLSPIDQPRCPLNFTRGHVERKNPAHMTIWGQAPGFGAAGGRHACEIGGVGRLAVIVSSANEK